MGLIGQQQFPLEWPRGGRTIPLIAFDGSHVMLARVSGSGLPMPVAGHSLRPSRPSLARCFLRCAILASRRKQRRLPGTGSPSLPLVAQVFNLCVFSVHIVLRM